MVHNMDIGRGKENRMNKPHVRNLPWDELDKIMKELGEPAFRSRQLFQWIHQKGITSWEEMTDLPKKLRMWFAEHFSIEGLPVIRRLASRQDDTVKYLLRLPDGELVETVLMSYDPPEGKQRRTLCVSTQVGCPLKCAFCATGQSGFTRNLEVHEILGQVLAVNRDLVSAGQAPVSNLVFMGMGEPFLNYENLVQGIRLLHHPLGLNISWRRICVSTSGIVPGIYRLADEGMPLVLAVSLHAPNDELRSRLMPVNRRYPLEELVAACHYWVQRTNRCITFEYILLGGVNDSLAHAGELVGLLKGLLANVNLIPFNPVSDGPFVKPSRNKVMAFRQYLEDHGVTAVIREEKGGDIEAACGQLRRREMRG